jgi:hypothetical protein
MTVSVSFISSVTKGAERRILLPSRNACATLLFELNGADHMEMAVCAIWTFCSAIWRQSWVTSAKRDHFTARTSEKGRELARRALPSHLSFSILVISVRQLSSPRNLSHAPRQQKNRHTRTHGMRRIPTHIGPILDEDFDKFSAQVSDAVTFLIDPEFWPAIQCPVHE